MTLEHLNDLYSLIKTSELNGRYITNTHVENALEKLPKSRITVLGRSVQERPIYCLKYGKGTIKILLWSQMHGNESTSTKALFDCFGLFETKHEIPQSILSACTIVVIPILNPDGAQDYTRVNANGIDLNRDARDLSQPESKVLRDVFKSFKPDFCFNLHGQRSIYNVGDTSKSAILSFLSPAQDVHGLHSNNRKSAMAIISKVNAFLQDAIPGGIGRYDDTFNINCVGDMFQSLNTPTLLYEAGHYPNDYHREEVRRLLFIALLKGLEVIAKGFVNKHYNDYFLIPQNNSLFYDIIIKNVRVNENLSPTNLGVLYSERLVDGKIDFIPTVAATGNLNHNYGHRVIDLQGERLTWDINHGQKVINEIDFVSIRNHKIMLKP